MRLYMRGVREIYRYLRDEVGKDPALIRTETYAYKISRSVFGGVPIYYVTRISKLPETFHQVETPVGLQGGYAGTGYAISALGLGVCASGTLTADENGEPHLETGPAGKHPLDDAMNELDCVTLLQELKDGRLLYPPFDEGEPDKHV